jgi:large subunit ribosomal protein L6
MSNLGKIKIFIPNTVSIYKTTHNKNSDNFYNLKFLGPLATISLNLPNYIDINLLKDSISLQSSNKVMWGTSRNLIQQAITGVSTGFTKKLELVGIGYKLSLSNNSLTFYIGKSHPVIIPVIDNVKINVLSPTSFLASSPYINILSTFLHSIKLIKPTYNDHYKGKGIKITNP